MKERKNNKEISFEFRSAGESIKASIELIQKDWATDSLIVDHSVV